METNKNLKEAFAGESQANRKYLAFAKKAEKEKFRQIAKLFRAAADAETVHALKHLEVMGGVKSTKENLKAAIDGETFEFTKMYPAMIAQAEKDSMPEAKMAFTAANAVEKIHAKHFQDAMASLENGTDMQKQPMHVCQVCGNTFVGDVPENCPICGVKKSMFKEIE